MKRHFIYAAVVIFAGATATLAVSPLTSKPATSSEALFAADGAFRDGLYLGRLAAESAQPRRVAVGRWSTSQDRSSFIAGYSQGYNANHADTPVGPATE